MDFIVNINGIHAIRMHIVPEIFPVPPLIFSFCSVVWVLLLILHIYAYHIIFTLFTKNCGQIDYRKRLERNTEIALIIVGAWARRVTFSSA